MTEAAVNRKAGWISFFLVLTIIAVFSYLAVRTFLFILAPYFWYEKIVAMFLLVAEGFILIHSFGYFLNV